MAAVAASGTAQGHRRTSQVVRDLERLTEILKLKAVQEKPPWIKTVSGNCFFGVLILVNGLFIGIDIQWVDGFHYGFWAVESLFLTLFIVELVLRFQAERPHYCNFFDAWGVTDLALTALGCADTWIMTPVLFFGQSSDAENPLGHLTVFRMVRLLRLVRLVRVLRKFNDLLVLVKTIRNSVKAVGWMSLLLGLLIYTGSIFTVLLLGLPYRDTDPAIDAHFGSLGSSLFSHFLVVTLERWPIIATSAMEQSRWWSLYFAMMISFGNGALVNVMVGIIVEQVLRLSWERQLRRASFNTALRELKSTMVMLFNMADLDSSGDLGKEELRDLLRDPRAHDIMLAFGMNMHIPPSMLHTIVDLNGDGACTFPEFFDACMRLSGSIDSLHGVFVQHDICHCKEVLRKSLLGLEEDLRAIVPKREGRKRSLAAEAPEHEDSVAEAEITALRERLDRFAEKQKLMQAELQALKEQWQPVCREGPPFNDSSGKHLSISDSTTGDGSISAGDASSLGASLPLPPPSPARMQPASPLAAVVKAARAPRMFLHAFGREIGVGVMDSVFGDPPQRPHSAEPWARRRPGGLRAAARRQLEAEFAAKKAAEALRHG